MAIRIVPLVCGICGNSLKAKDSDQVFLCSHCVKAFEPQETTDNVFEVLSSSSKDSSIFLPYFLIRGTVTENEIEIVDLDDLAELSASDYFGTLNPVHDNEKTKEEIVISAGKKMIEAKILKKPYSLSVAVPAFKSKNAIQYGMEYGKIFPAEPSFGKEFAEPSLSLQMSSGGAVLTAKNLILNARANENSYILSIDFDWRIDIISVVILGFKETGGILVNEETGLKIPKTALKEDK